MPGGLFETVSHEPARTVLLMSLPSSLGFPAWMDDLPAGYRDKLIFDINDFRSRIASSLRNRPDTADSSRVDVYARSLSVIERTLLRKPDLAAVDLDTLLAAAAVAASPVSTLWTHPCTCALLAMRADPSSGPLPTLAYQGIRFTLHRANTMDLDLVVVSSEPPTRSKHLFIPGRTVARLAGGPEMYNHLRLQGLSQSQAAKTTRDALSRKIAVTSPAPAPSVRKR